MKKIIFLAIASLFTCSCNNNGTSEEKFEYAYSEEEYNYPEDHGLAVDSLQEVFISEEYAELDQ